MCTPMNNGIGLKLVAHPKVGSDVRMRWRIFGTMNNSEGILTQPGQRLRQQHYIAKLQPGHCEVVFVFFIYRKILPRRIPKFIFYQLITLLFKVFSYPLFIKRGFYQSRISVLQKVVKGAFGIGAQYRTLCFDHFP